MAHVMRITCTSVFVVTFVLGWLFFAWFGDFNMYIIHRDGGRWIKSNATPSSRIVFGFLIALLFAAIDTALLWAWQKWRSRAHVSTIPPHDKTA